MHVHLSLFICPYFNGVCVFCVSAHTTLLLSNETPTCTDVRHTEGVEQIEYHKMTNVSRDFMFHLGQLV